MSSGPSSAPPQLDPAEATSSTRKMTAPSSHRLQTITEGNRAPPIPPKSQMRHSASSLSLPLPRSVILAPPRAWTENRASEDTSRTAPPAYEWIPRPDYAVEDETLDRGPVEGEKLAALRRQGGWRRQQRQFGGCNRILLILGVLLLLIIALGVGLGVGLSRKRSNNASGDTNSPAGAGGSTEALPFPLGDYSLVTALKDVTTDCTSNAATWSCYPYSTYDMSTTRSAAVFNWAVANTSSSYATIGTPVTATEGIPANLTIEANSDQFGVTFGKLPLTFISSSNTSAARYTFSFTQSKNVFPAATITTDNSAAQCFFNQTTFSGTLYLSAPRSYPNNTSGDATGSTVGGFTQWPYAVEVTQTSGGGDNTPACYRYSNGAVGDRITTGFTPQSADAQCLCGYRNY